VIADPFAQLRLLELQVVDTAVNQLRHRRETLPELAAISAADERAAENRAALLEAETAATDLASEQRRLENDVDTVRNRATKDQARMTSSGVPAKEISGLQHEVASLARRQTVLEDELLELMERRETADAAVTELSADAASIGESKLDAQQARDASFAEIDEALSNRNEQRNALTGTIPADLLALYDKVAAANGGVGAAMLRQRRCEGCRLELAGSELSSVRTAKPEQVVRCDNCGRILIRTAESGL
jgi:uncharacterized protein